MWGDLCEAKKLPHGSVQHAPTKRLEHTHNGIHTNCMYPCLTMLFHVVSQLLHRECAQERRAVGHVQAFGQRELPCAGLFQVTDRHARRDAARIQIDGCRRA